MDRLPDGGVALTFGELGTSVIAVDLSPQRIANSSLATRLRQAEAALSATVRDSDYAEVVDEFIQARARQAFSSSSELAARVLQSTTGIDSMRTIIPAPEVELFEECIIKFLDVGLDRIERYIAKRLSVTGLFDPILYATYHMGNAAMLFDELFPPTEE